ncbi:MAG: protein tyrosine phosphatase [Cyclobacteriaceae bacterium]|jgi:protein-tyrosine phosphatase|nr:protein tyrosine phosphatase [Cyclobacteriaceae bacterium]
MNLLFICSRNQWRSRTAETIFKNHPLHQVRSAGTENEARIRVNEKMIAWADIIFVMEKHHRQRLLEKFPQTVSGKKVIILEIEDSYTYMNAELIETLKLSVAPYLQSE